MAQSKDASDLDILEIFSDNWQKMDIPDHVNFTNFDSDKSKARFVLEPLYKGYGMTIGNSLRRVLMSSLIGAAVYAVKIEGVTNEYQPIKNVREDVLQIILNLKELRIKPFVKGPFEAQIKVQGPRVVKASDIETGAKFEVGNPDLIICHVEQDVELDIKLFIKFNRGYVSSEENFQHDLPIGTIYLDSNHSPIKKIQYNVENTRVRQKTDYERLLFDIETNGSITPKDAVAYGCKILRDYFEAFITFESSNLKSAVTKETDVYEPNPHFEKSINELELSIRSINCLQNAKIETIGQLVQKTEAEMLKTKNFGKKSLQEIKNILAGMGLGLGMNLSAHLENKQAH